MGQILYCLFIYLNILSVTHQQVLFTKGNGSEKVITDSLRPLLTDIATNSMVTEWLNIKADFDTYMQNITARWNELSDRALDLQKSFSKQFLGAASRKTCPTDVDAGFILNGDFCYLFTSVQHDWNTAKLKCIEMNAFLARPDTEDKDAFLEDHAAKLDVAYWVGASDLNVEGVWRWTDNDDDLTFSNWSPQQPNDWGSNQDCLSIGFEAEGRRAWNDDNCQNDKPYICQREAMQL